jgi:hypothetical protein
MNGSAALATDSFKVPYTGGNGGAHSGQIVSSTGVTGLTATLNAGSFKTGNDSVTYSISGTPSGTGNATFALNIGGRNCNYVANVLPPVGVVTTLNCAGGSVSGTLSNGVAANGVSFTIPYTGGNAGTYNADTISVDYSDWFEGDCSSRIIRYWGWLNHLHCDWDTFRQLVRLTFQFQKVVRHVRFQLQ